MDMSRCASMSGLTEHVCEWVWMSMYFTNDCVLDFLTVLKCEGKCIFSKQHALPFGTKCSERKGKNKPIVGNSNKTFWGYIWRHSPLWNEVEDFFGRFLTWTKSKCAQRMMQPRGKCWNCDCILIYRRNDLQLHLALQNCTWFHANSSSNTIACNQFGVRMEGAINKIQFRAYLDSTTTSGASIKPSSDSPQLLSSILFFSPQKIHSSKS